MLSRKLLLSSGIVPWCWECRRNFLCRAMKLFHRPFSPQESLAASTEGHQNTDLATLTKMVTGRMPSRRTCLNPSTSTLFLTPIKQRHNCCITREQKEETLANELTAKLQNCQTSNSLLCCALLCVCVGRRHLFCWQHKTTRCAKTHTKG